MKTIENENLKQDNVWLNRILTLVTTIGLAISSYFLTNTIYKLDSLEKRVYTVEMSDAKSSGVTFTVTDWTIQKSLMDADKYQNEKRLTNLESSIPVIKESLIRIETALEKTNDRIK